MPIARGFSLLEILIAMAISSTLMLSSLKLLPSLQMAVLRQSQDIIIQEDLWMMARVIGKHLQRAGYCAGTCSGEGLTVSNNGRCIIVRWDANNNGVWEKAIPGESELTGFRLHENALETLRGARACTDSGWEKMSEPALFSITDFQVVTRNLQGYPPRMIVTLDAVATRNSEQTYRVSHQVTGYNLP